MQWYVQRLLCLLFALLNEALLIGHLPMRMYCVSSGHRKHLGFQQACMVCLIHLELALVFHVLLRPLCVLHTRK